MEGARSVGSIRLAELMAALSLATDLGLGQPLQHEVGVCLASLELANRLGCSIEERTDVYYVALVAHVGCTGATAFFADWAGGDDIHFQRGAQVLGAASEPSEDLRFFVRRFADDRPLPERIRRLSRMLIAGERRFELMAENLCEGATLLARRLRLPEQVALALAQLTERWDGNGVPGMAAGEQIAPPLRIVRVAQDLVAVAHAVDRQAAIDALTRRRGRGHDPAVVDAALADPDGLLAVARLPDAWERVIASEPEPIAVISPAGLETVARRVHRREGRLPARPLRAGGRALGIGVRGARVLTRGGRGGPRRRLPARRRQGRGAQRHLGEGRPAEHRRA